MNPDVRNAILTAGRGVFLGGISLLIILLIGLGLLGALRNPPRR